MAVNDPGGPVAGYAVGPVGCGWISRADPLSLRVGQACSGKPLKILSTAFFGPYTASPTRAISPAAVESGRGPQRTLYTATPEGRQVAAQWLDTPVEHVRDVRSQLLLKLALLDRVGRDPTDLLRRQRAILEPIAEAVRTERPQRKGFDATLLAWRRATAAAAMNFLDDILRQGS